jgi:leader peptidase (prepilin peptidase)/N-methyltransferase
VVVLESDPLLPPEISFLILALIGGLLGLTADRVSSRWPEHEDEAIRGVDWRTAVVTIAGALAIAQIGARFDDPVERAVFGVYFVALIVLFATDLDQRLLPDVITLPAIPLAFLFAISGANPLLAGGLSFGLVGALVAAVALPGLLLLLSIPFGRDAIGLGDVKLLVSVGLMSGFARGFIGLFAGALAMAVIVIVLLAARRITLKSYVPMGPFLIGGAMWGILLPGLTLG